MKKKVSFTINTVKFIRQTLKSFHYLQKRAANPDCSLFKQCWFHDVSCIWIASEVTVCQLGNHAPPGSALDETLHNEEWLIDFLDSAGILANGCGYGGKSDRTATELVNDGKQYLVVYLVKAVLVNV